MSESTLDLKSRSIWQLMASYGIGAWITLQVADTLSSLIGLPLWFGRALLVALVAGFVVLVATSLVQRGSRLGAGGLASVLTWRNWRRGGIAAALLVVVATGGYLALRSAGIGPIGTLQARGVFDAQERIILADFGGEVEPAGLTETVTTLLRIDLAQSPAFTVLEPVQLAPVMARMQRDPAEPLTYEAALEAARREGIKAVVAGELLQAGSSYVVSARIVTASTGEVLVAVRETVDEVSEIPDGVDRLSAQLRERIGESLRSIQGDPPLAEVTTASMQALEKYVQADRANNRGDADRALVLLEEALAEDSTFAMAHRKLGILLENLAMEPERADRAFTRAYELRDRLSDRERWLAEAAYLDYVAGDKPAALDRYVTLLEAYPTDRIALNNLAINYRTLGRTEEAADLLLRSIGQGGAPASTYSGAIGALVQLGDVAQAESILASFGEAYPSNPGIEQLRVDLAAARLDYVAAEGAAERFLDRVRGTPLEGGALVKLGNVQLVRGRLEDAWETFEDAFDAFEAAGIDPGATPGAAEAVFGGIVALYYREDPEEAVRIVQQARAAGRVAEQPAEYRLDVPLAEIVATAGRPDLARTLLDAYAADTEDEDYSESFPWRLATGRVALAEGREGEALELLHEALSDNPGCTTCGRQALGEAFVQMERPDSAIHYFEEYVSAPFLGRLESSDNVGFWAVVPALAELHAEHGDPARARELLTHFLEVTEVADTSFAAKRDRMRRVLTGLSGP